MNIQTVDVPLDCKTTLRISSHLGGERGREDQDHQHTLVAGDGSARNTPSSTTEHGKRLDHYQLQQHHHHHHYQTTVLKCSPL